MLIQPANNFKIRSQQLWKSAPILKKPHFFRQSSRSYIVFTLIMHEFVQYSIIKDKRQHAKPKWNFHLSQCVQKQGDEVEHRISDKLDFSDFQLLKAFSKLEFRKQAVGVKSNLRMQSRRRSMKTTFKQRAFKVLHRQRT